MAVNGVALIRQKSLFYLKAVDGASPVSKKNKKYNSDHSGTINFFIDLFSGDVLLSQVIEDTNVYDWLMKKREQINYRERQFNEPDKADFWENIAEQVEKGNLRSLLNSYISDSYILCFQEEHAALAVPIKRALLTRLQLSGEDMEINFSDVQKAFLFKLLPVRISELDNLIGDIG